MALCATPPPAHPTGAYCARDTAGMGLAHVFQTLDTDCPLPPATLLSIALPLSSPGCVPIITNHWAQPDQKPTPSKGL